MLNLRRKGFLGPFCDSGFTAKPHESGMNITGKNRKQPYIGLHKPFVRIQLPIKLPFISNYIPFVGIRKIGGFTLIELMIVLLVVAVLAAIGAPAFQRFMESNRLTSATNTFLADLSLARSEAIKRQLGQVVVCTSSSGTGCGGTTVPWTAGWIVFWDSNSSNSYAVADGDVLLKVQGSLPASLSTTTEPGSTALIAYNRLGARATTIESVQITNTELSTNRLICINAVGRAFLPTGVSCV